MTTDPKKDLENRMTWEEGDLTVEQGEPDDEDDSDALELDPSNTEAT